MELLGAPPGPIAGQAGRYLTDLRLDRGPPGRDEGEPLHWAHEQGHIVQRARILSVRPPKNEFGCGAHSTSSTTGYALCTNGTGIGSDAYRVHLTCRHQGSNYSAYGPWVNPTQRSTKTCPSGSIYSLTVNHA